MAAEQHQVPERRGAASGPVVDVVRIEEAAVLAAGKAAAAVACTKRPAGGRAGSCGSCGRCGRGWRRRRACGRSPGRARSRRRARSRPRRRGRGPSRRRGRRPGSARRPGGSVGVGERGIRGGDERLGVRRLPRRPRFRGTAALPPERVAHRLEGPQQERPVLGREPAVDRERPVGLPEHAQVRVLLQLARLLAGDAPVGPHRPLELGRGEDPGEREQLLLVLGGRDPGERAHLRVRQLAPGEGGMDKRQLRSRRATRTCSRAARGVSAQRQASHSAQEDRPDSAKPPRRSSSATSSSQRQVPAYRCEASVASSASSSSRSSAARSSIGLVAITANSVARPPDGTPRPVPTAARAGRQLRGEPADECLAARARRNRKRVASSAPPAVSSRPGHTL